MITNNYKKFYAMGMDLTNNAATASKTYEKEYDITTTTGTVVKARVRDNTGTTNSIIFKNTSVACTSANSIVNGVQFGNGTREVSEDDFTLSGEVIYGIAYTSISEVVVDETGVKKEVVFTLTNNNNNDVTIAEIGYFTSFQYIRDNNSVGSGFALIERTLLNTPVTIPAGGGVGQVTYTIDVNLV